MLSRAADNARVILTLEGPGVVHWMALPVQPSQVTYYIPARVTYTQTIGGVYNDDFGYGVPIITLQGNSGYWNSTRGVFDGRAGLDGYTMIQLLQQYFYRLYFELEGSSLYPNPNVALRFSDTFSGRHYLVKWYQELQLQQDQESPVTFNYTFTFEVLADLSGSGASFAKIAHPSSPVLPENREAAASRLAASASSSLPSPQGKVFRWTVNPGDTIYSILTTLFGTPPTSAMVDEVLRRNKLGDPRRLPVGFVLVIPSSLPKGRKRP